MRRPSSVDGTSTPGTYIRTRTSSSPSTMPICCLCTDFASRIPVMVSIDSLTGPTVLDARLSAFWTMSTKLQSREEVCIEDQNGLRVFVVRQTGTRIRAGPFFQPNIDACMQANSYVRECSKARFVCPSALLYRFRFRVRLAIVPPLNVLS